MRRMVIAASVLLGLTGAALAADTQVGQIVI